MPTNETEEFEFRLRAEKERSAAPGPAEPQSAPKPVSAITPPMSTPGGAATGFYPSMGVRRPESQQGRDASARAPVAAAQGAVAGAVGAPGDIEQLGRAGLRFAGANVDPHPALPTSEFLREHYLREGAQPIERAAAGLGSMVGPGVAGPAGKAVSRGAEITGQAVRGVTAPIGRAASKVGEFVGDVRGTQVPQVRAAATDAARSTIEAGAKSSDLRVKALEDVRSALDKKLEAGRATPPNLDVQGGAVRESFTGAMKVAKDARAAKADEMFGAVKEAAAAKEAAGARVDTAAVEDSLVKMLDQAQGIPDLENGLNKMLSSIRGRPAEVPKIALPPGVQRPPSAAAPAQGKTFEQLELTRRYLNDIGYGADVEGYPAILRGEARNAAKAVDTAMQQFVPEFKVYKDTYRAMSEPMESLGTRFGRAMAGTEGGLKEGAYSKVANADLPNRIFAKKEGVELMIDALAGGKNAPPAARTAAARQVDQMVENWILEQSRQKAPSAALEGLSAPGMRGPLSSVPGAEKRLTERFGQAKSTAETSEKVGKLAVERKDIGAKLRTDLVEADRLAASVDAKSQAKAVDAYKAILARGKTSGAITKEKYDAALALIDRAATIEERAAKAKKLAAKIALYVGLPAVGVEVGRRL